MAEVDIILTEVAGPVTIISEIGDPSDLSSALLIVNRLSELDTPQAKIDARTNLELQHIDCGEFL